ncbi:Uncharacterised protein [Cedecea neteri]|uniref:Uncharacterized protein n=1 Tax=Cedecea neteri TaxID=158822 RepID=A0A2X2SUC4_9ENTR|nr:Uncharacterised protein [Cedecea neteri]
MAVRETLSNNRLVSTMNRDMEQWVNGLPGKPAGDFRRVGALSPRAQAALRGHQSRPWPRPVITLTDAVVQHALASGQTLWPRLVSALYRPDAVVTQGENVTVVTRGTGERLAVTLVPFAEGCASPMWHRMTRRPCAMPPCSTGHYLTRRTDRGAGNHPDNPA